MRLLYDYEHKIMPKAFYEDPVGFLRTVILTGNIDNLYKNIARQMEIEAFGDFELKEFPKIEELDYHEVAVIGINCPLPKILPGNPFASDIVLIVNVKTADCFYFTIEPDVTGVFLCGWTKDGLHRNFGLIKEEENITEKIAKSYLSMINKENE